MTSSIKYGIYLPNFGAYGSARVLADLARDAEEAGWDGFFLWDHIAGWKLPMVDPWVALAAIAVNTQRVRIGTTVTPVPRRRPWKLAREAVSIDHLSNGRLTLGVGIGEGQAEYDHLDEEPNIKTRGAMLDEALEILTGLWSGEPFSYTGQHYRIEEVQFLPKPVQQPRIPIWVGGNWPNKPPFRRAARWDGVFPLIWDDDNEVELARIKELTRYVSRHRKTDQPFEVVIMGVTPDAVNTEGLEQVAQRAALGADWWLEPITPFRGGVGFEGEWPVEIMRERILQGPPRVA